MLFERATYGVKKVFIASQFTDDYYGMYIIWALYSGSYKKLMLWHKLKYEGHFGLSTTTHHF
jgi:hypothetical protein